MKQLLFLLLFPAYAFAQYPANANQKITLGEQTTADGLVWRGRLADTANLLTNKLDTSVYIVLDTGTQAMWYYRASTTPKWTRLVDSLNNLQGQLSLTSKVTGTLPVANGGTGSATQNFVDLTTTQSINGVKTFMDTIIVNKGIRFPATQSASTNVNTLDDYEEGTWTPILGGNASTSGQTYVYQIGRYTKIGRLVYCTFEVQLSTKGTITTRANILGLPFTTSGTGTYLDAGSVVISFFQNLASNQIYLSGYLIGNITQLELTATNTATTIQNNLSASDAYLNNTRIAGTVTYFAN